MTSKLRIRTGSPLGVAVATALIAGVLVGLGYGVAAKQEWAAFKQNGRLAQLVVFAGLLVGGWLAARPVGRVVRTFQYEMGGRGLRRRSLWGYVPAWLGLFVPVAGWAYGMWGRSGYWAGLGVVGAAIAVVAGALYWWMPGFFRWAVYVPGGRREVGLERVKLVEIRRGTEGPAELVVRFKDGGSWTVARGGMKCLQRLGSHVGRRARLVRQDLWCWER